MVVAAQARLIRCLYLFQPNQNATRRIRLVKILHPEKWFEDRAMMHSVREARRCLTPNPYPHGRHVLPLSAGSASLDGLGEKRSVKVVRASPSRFRTFLRELINNFY
jgi:hypothetical protein